MLAKYAIIIRRAGAITAAAAVVMVAVSAALAGVKGLYGALIGVGLVAVFFGLSVLVVGRAARVSPQAMMVAAMVTYVVKIVALAVVVSMLHGMTAFSDRALGFTAIGCILVWSAAQVITAVKIKMLYVEPDQQQTTSKHKPRGEAGDMSDLGNEAVTRAQKQAAAEGRAQGLETGWTVFSYLLAGMAAYGIIGWLIGRAVHVPLLFPLGMLLGLGISIGYIIHRFGRQQRITQPRVDRPRKEITGDR